MIYRFLRCDLITVISFQSLKTLKPTGQLLNDADKKIQRSSNDPKCDEIKNSHFYIISEIE